MSKNLNKVLILLAILVMSFLVLFGCNSNNESSQANGEGSGETILLRMPGSVLGGAFYAQSSTLADFLNKHMNNINITVEVSQGGHDNIAQVSADAHLAIGNSMAAYQAINGINPFPEKATKLMAICWAGSTQTQMVTLKESGIESYSDLKGKIVSVGAKGSGTEASTKPLLESIGIKYEDFKQVEYLSLTESVSALKDRKIDAFIFNGAYPTSNVVELSTVEDINLISLSEEEMASIEEEVPFFMRDKIPAGTYKGVEKDINVMTLKSLLTVNKNVPDQLVYDITKNIYENIETLAKGHIGFNNWEFNSNIETLVPLHPGAKKFYSENNL